NCGFAFLDDGVESSFWHRFDILSALKLLILLPERLSIVDMEAQSLSYDVVVSRTYQVSEGSISWSGPKVVRARRYATYYSRFQLPATRIRRQRNDLRSLKGRGLSYNLPV